MAELIQLDNGTTIEVSDSFEHPENYGPYIELLQNNGRMTVRTADINKISYNFWFETLVNFMKDGIEHPYWHGAAKIDVIFTDGQRVILTPNDFMFNLIMWYSAVVIDEPISCKYLFWVKELKNSAIVDYLDKVLVEIQRSKHSNRFLNNAIADCTARFAVVDSVSKYFANTINFYDDIALMKKNPRYKQLLHLDLTGQALDKVNNITADATSEAIDIIKSSKKELGYDHCLAGNFRTGEALNTKQFCEVYISIGTKSDANGQIFPMIMNTSYINGGLYTLAYMTMDDSNTRKATIYSHINVGVTGHLARRLRLLNQVTFLNADPNFVCKSRNPEEVIIRDAATLERFNNRYYMLVPNGVTHKLNKYTDKHLIGKKIYVRSPMTCASYAAGKGICYKCYGDLAYTNATINIGVLAAELLSSNLTQRLLSAKHLLKTNITTINWCDEFDRYFTVNINEIRLNNDEDFRGYKIHLSVDDLDIIEYEDDEEDDNASSIMHKDENNVYSIDRFILETPYGECIPIHSKAYDKMTLSGKLAQVVEHKLNKDPNAEVITIDLSYIDYELFRVDIENIEMTKSLKDIENIINKVSVTTSMDRNQILQAFIDTLNTTGIKLDAVHAEVILANQMFSQNEDEDIGWEYKVPKYIIYPLDKSLLRNPSVTISLSFQHIVRQLSDPRTFKKHRPSNMDLFFMVHPQEYLQSTSVVPTVHEVEEIDLYSNKPMNPFVVIPNHIC